MPNTFAIMGVIRMLDLTPLEIAICIAHGCTGIALVKMYTNAISAVAHALTPKQILALSVNPVLVSSPTGTGMNWLVFPNSQCASAFTGSVTNVARITFPTSAPFPSCSNGCSVIMNLAVKVFKMFLSKVIATGNTVECRDESGLIIFRMSRKSDVAF